MALINSSVIGSLTGFGRHSSQALSLRRRFVTRATGTDEVEGHHAGGHVTSVNRKQNRRDRRLSENRTAKCGAVVGLRDGGRRRSLGRDGGSCSHIAPQLATSLLDYLPSTP